MDTDPRPATRRHRRRPLDAAHTSRLADASRRAMVGAHVARETGATYETAGACDGAISTGSSSSGSAPFGLPVLRELPRLAGLLTALADADRLAVEAVLTFADLAASDEVEATTGVGLDHWLAATVRATRLDRSTLRRICRMLVRLPSTRSAAVAGRLSFAQLRTLALETRRAPNEILAPLDRWLAAAIEQLSPDADPDAIVSQAGRAIDELWPQQVEHDERQASGRRYLALQPNLDGSGGRFYGEEDAIGFATLDAATAVRRGQLDQDLGRARADNLQAWLDHACQPEVDAVTNDGGDDRDDAGEPGATDTRRRRTPPKLLVRIDYDALFDRTATPATLLTRMVGGRLRLTSREARRLVDERGAELRTIIVDDGRVIGVGRATRIPPGWLHDVTLALHDTCTEPLCDRPALGADTDHAIGWFPTEPDQPYGRTDEDNLGPLCPGPNRDKQRSGWRTVQSHAGIRTWHHARSGIRITSVPATWRPSGLDPPPHLPGCGDPHRGPPSGRDGRSGARRAGADDDPLPF